MPSAQQTIDFETVREDINALREQMSTLLKHVGTATSAKAGTIYDELRDQGAETLRDQVRATPVASVAVAFTLGVVAALLLRAR